MKTPLIIALLLATAATAVPTIAAAKKGDFYRNTDGSCDKGDVRKGYWCVESMSAPSGGKKPKAGSAPAPQRIYPKPGVSLTEKPMP